MNCSGRQFFATSSKALTWWRYVAGSDTMKSGEWLDLLYHTVHSFGWSCSAGQSQHTYQIVIRITLCSMTHCLHSGISSIWQNYLTKTSSMLAFQFFVVSIHWPKILPYHVIQLHCVKVLAFSATSFHLTWSWLYFVQLFKFIILKSSFISFSHLIVGIGFHSYNFLTIPSLSFGVRGQTSSIFKPQCN